MLKVIKRMATMPHNRGKPVLSVIPYFLSISICILLIPEGIILLNAVKLRQVSCRSGLSWSKWQGKSNLGSDMARVWDILFQSKSVVILHPITVALLNCSKVGPELAEKWFWGVNLVTFDWINCSINQYSSPHWRFADQSTMDLYLDSKTLPTKQFYFHYLWLFPLVMRAFHYENSEIVLTRFSVHVKDTFIGMNYKIQKRAIWLHILWALTINFTKRAI